MRPRLGRALIGYAVPATRTCLAQIESELEAEREARSQTLLALEARLEGAEADVARLEQEIAREREEHRALMAVLDTISAISREAVSRVEADLRNEEAGLLSALAQRQVLLGERRSLIASFQAEAQRLIRDTRRRLSQQRAAPSAKPGGSSAAEPNAAREPARPAPEAPQISNAGN